MQQSLRLLRAAHVGLASCVTLSLAAVILAYGVADGLGLQAQIAAHIALIVMPAGIKISYVARLTALKQLGRPVN